MWIAGPWGALHTSFCVDAPRLDPRTTISEESKANSSPLRFVHDDQQQIFRAIVQVLILHHRASWLRVSLQANSKLRFPMGMDADAQMLIKGMLEVNPARRLGNLKDGLSAVPGSTWFQATKFEWTALSARSGTTPYQPPVKDAKDTSNIDIIRDEESIPK